MDHRNGIYLDSLRAAFEASNTHLVITDYPRLRASHMRMWEDLIRWYCGFKELSKDKENQDEEGGQGEESPTLRSITQLLR